MLWTFGHRWSESILEFISPTNLSFCDNTFSYSTLQLPAYLLFRKKSTSNWWPYQVRIAPYLEADWIISDPETVWKLLDTTNVILYPQGGRSWCCQWCFLHGCVPREGQRRIRFYWWQCQSCYSCKSIFLLFWIGILITYPDFQSKVDVASMYVDAPLLPARWLLFSLSFNPS